jgi:hypothetical protein
MDRYSTWLGLFLFGIGILVAFLAALAGMEAKDVGGALGGIIGGFLGAAGAYLGVYATIQRDEKIEREKSEHLLQSIRIALYTEVKLTSLLCSRLCDEISRNLLQINIAEKIYELRIPDSVVFKSLSDKIGLLGSEEVSSLVKYQHTLEDLRIISFSEKNPKIILEDAFPIYLLLSSACGYAAKFLSSVPNQMKSKEDIERFIPELQRLRQESDLERLLRIPGYTSRNE